MDQQDVDQQDTATSAHGASHVAGSSHRDGSHRIPSVQGKPPHASEACRSGSAQNQRAPEADAIRSALEDSGSGSKKSNSVMVAESSGAVKE
jgi:hypothetical protein